MDRLAALQNAPSAPVPVSVPEATAVPVESEDPLERGFKLVETIQSKTRDFQNQTVEVKMRGEDVLRSVDAKSDGTLTRLQQSMDDANKISNSIKRELDKLKANINDLKKGPDGRDDEQKIAGNADVIRIQENQLQHQTMQFVAAMNEYNAVVRTNEKGIQEQVKARIKLKYTNDKGCTISEKDLQDLAQEYVSDMQQDSAKFQNAKHTLGEIMENRQDYVKMARSMRELGQLYQDLAAILSEQSVLMDQIHTNFQTANKYVEDGRAKLQSGKKYAKKNRKCMVGVFVCVGIIFVFILAVILGFKA